MTTRLFPWLLVAAIATALGCDEQKTDKVMPRVPLPRYLSRDIEPADGRVDAVAPTQAPTSAEAPAPGGAADRTPDEVAEEVKAAVSRLQQRDVASRREERPLAVDQAPPVRQGEPPVKVSVEVPLEGDQPIQRTGRQPAARAIGDVALTEITPAGSGAAMVRPADEVPVPPSGTGTSPQTEVQTPAAAARQPKAAAAPVSLEELVRHYEDLAAKDPDDVEIARTLRFIYFLAGDDERSLEAIPGLPPEEQKLWRGLMWTLLSARDRLPGMSRSAQAAEVLQALDDVRAVLREQAPLELGEVRFCQTIEDFGSYTPVAVNRYRPGEQALLYSEIRNFVSEKGSDGLYRVRLNVALSLEKADGTSVWRETIPDIEDACRQIRHDFFLTTRIPVPRDLEPGKYALKVTFEDAATKKQAAARLDLEVAGPGR